MNNLYSTVLLKGMSVSVSFLCYDDQCSYTFLNVSCYWYQVFLGYIPRSRVAGVKHTWCPTLGDNVNLFSRNIVPNVCSHQEHWDPVNLHHFPNLIISNIKIVANQLSMKEYLLWFGLAFPWTLMKLKNYLHLYTS